MSVTTLRPNGTASTSGSITVTGAASAHAALSDESDSSYVTAIDNGDGVYLDCTALSLPAGALIGSVALRARVARSSAGTSTIWFGSFPVFSGGVFTVGWTAPATVTIGTTSDFAPFHADLANLNISLLGATPGSPGSGVAPGSIRVYELYFDVTYVEIPELSIIAPTGTIVDTNVPTVTWTPDIDGDGGAQTHYEVAVVANGDDPDADPIIVGSGALAGSGTSWQLDEPLPDGAYDCYVRIAQTISSAQHWSDWEKSDFVIDVLLPGEPTFNLVPESSNGRMRLDIESDTGGDVTTDRYEVQASYDGGETFATIRTPEGYGLATPESDAAMLWDREGGNGQDVTYRVRALHDYSGLYAASAWVEETGMWGPTRTCWLKHPLDPSQDLVVRIDAYGESSIAARQSHMHPLGRSSVIIAADKHGPETGAVTFLTPDQDARDALKALLRANPATPLLFQVGAADKRPDRWVIFGQIDTAYIVDKSWIDDTRETLGWTEVPRP